MPRYAKQRDTFSCGPTALINIFKWAGKSISYRASRQEWIRNCATTKEGTPPGILLIAINRHLHNYGVSHTLRIGSRQGIIAHARQGGAALIRFNWPGLSWAHYFLTVGATRHYVDVVNLFTDKPAMCRIHRKTFTGLLAEHKSIWCWLLTKN